ncbi:hypothetical protein E9993_04160 [Labilibacter sediminis]|nr:hypothetical protein E9993_04160 [Labilibacter sediminis]
MKPYKTIRFILCILLSFSSSFTSGQNKLNVNPELKANSTPIKIKPKGIGAIPKYEFGGYKIISRKGGWTVTKTKRDNYFFPDNIEISSRKKSSFLLINPAKDSVIANITENSITNFAVDSIINVTIIGIKETKDHHNIEIDLSVEAKNNWFNRTFFKWSGFGLTEGFKSFSAHFLFPKDSTTWNLLAISPLTYIHEEYSETDTTTRFHAALSNGITEIEIKEISYIKGTKFSLIRGYPKGFEFYLDGKAVAAIQNHWHDRLYIWFHNELDEDVKFVLASASVAMLIRGLDEESIDYDEL